MLHPKLQGCQGSRPDVGLRRSQNESLCDQLPTGPGPERKQYLTVSQHSDDRNPQSFDVLLQARSHGCSQLLQDGQGLLDLDTRRP